MTVVFIADDSPANAWLIREVERQRVIAAIVRPDWDAVRPSRTSGVRPSPPSTPARLMRRLRAQYFAWRDAASRQRLAQALFHGELPVAPRAPVWSVPAWEINAFTTAERIRALNPAVIVVSGAPMLRSNIYTMPRCGTVNLHVGICPNYRGMHTIITPLQRGDYAHLGATLHEVDDGVDSGPVLFRVYPDLTPDDTPESIEAKIVQRSATVVCEFLSRLDAGPREARIAGRRFTEPGQLVRFHDRRIRDDLQFRLRRMMGERPPTLPGRVEGFDID